MLTLFTISEVTQTENIKQNVSGDTRDTLKYNGPGESGEIMSINNLPRLIINQDIDIFMVFVAVQHAVIFVTVPSEKIPTQYWNFVSDEPNQCILIFLFYFSRSTVTTAIGVPSL